MVAAYIQSNKRVHIPKDLVLSFVVGDEIDNRFEAYEVALAMHSVPEEDWGVSLWKHMPTTWRANLLALSKEDRMKYPTMKEALVQKFGLTPERYRL